MRATMTLVVEAMGIRLSGSLPARYSPVSVSTSAHAPAFIFGGLGASCAAAPAADAGTRKTNANRTATIGTLRRCLTSPRPGKKYPLGVPSCANHDRAADGGPGLFCTRGTDLTTLQLEDAPR